MFSPVKQLREITEYIRMSKFIKITNLILNVKYIQSITVKPDKYQINMVSSMFDGKSISVAGFGIGSISSHNAEIEVCKIKHSNDYKIVSDWIDSQ
uniref:Uncharacterized protein n=1 Tax=viral metagenome TaxID=1070528 RepID=A0A6C0B5V0_9ZZZZ